VRAAPTWQIGEANSIYTDYGDLTEALHFTDPLNTTFVLNVGFQLPAIASGGSNNFTANLVAVDQVGPPLPRCASPVHAHTRSSPHAPAHVPPHTTFTRSQPPPRAIHAHTRTARALKAHPLPWSRNYLHPALCARHLAILNQLAGVPICRPRQCC
jgi:hypothetical protein